MVTGSGDLKVTRNVYRIVVNLSHDQIVREIHQRPGLIPIDIDEDKHKLVWFDVGDHHLAESYFFISTKSLISSQEKPILFATELNTLESDEILADFVYPTGFIFHMGRCGSTVLSKALARSPHDLVISEAPPHYLIWKFLQGDWLKPLDYSQENFTIYRNLILAMGRRRLSDQLAHFIKYTTYNILLIEFIHAVFPDVPCLFLYRDPAEVMVSYLRKGTGWFRFKNAELGAFTTGCSIEETRAMNQMAFIEKFLIRFISAALNASVEDLHFLNYDQLTPRNFEAILNVFNYTISPDQVALMRRQFNFYSRDDSDNTLFVPDKDAKQSEITTEIRGCVEEELTSLYDQLERSEKNLASIWEQRYRGAQF